MQAETVVAAVVRLLDQTGMRIGNDVYAAESGSYGLTTLKNRRARISGNHLTLEFKGKSGVMQHSDLTDRRVVRIVQQCHELPGQRLFQFVDDEGNVQHVRSEHVNDYIRAASGEDFTAKDFRTWHASVRAMKLVLEAADRASGDDGFELEATALVKQVAQRLGNTCAVCRKFYIHPRVLSLCDELPSANVQSSDQRSKSGKETYILDPVSSARINPEMYPAASRQRIRHVHCRVTLTLPGGRNELYAVKHPYTANPSSDPFTAFAACGSNAANVLIGFCRAASHPYG